MPNGRGWLLNFSEISKAIHSDNKRMEDFMCFFASLFLVSFLISVFCERNLLQEWTFGMVLLALMMLKPVQSMLRGLLMKFDHV